MHVLRILAKLIIPPALGMGMALARVWSPTEQCVSL